MIMPLIREQSMVWDPFTEFQRLRAEMDRVFTPYERRMAEGPALNLWSDDEEAVVQAEIPGVDPETLDLTVQGEILHVAGEIPEEEVGEQGDYLRRERRTGRFARQVRLPFEVESEQVKATIRHGLLTIQLPRKAATRPRHIAVEAA